MKEVPLTSHDQLKSGWLLGEVSQPIADIGQTSDNLRSLDMEYDDNGVMEVENHC